MNVTAAAVADVETPEEGEFEEGEYGVESEGA